MVGVRSLAERLGQTRESDVAARTARAVRIVDDDVMHSLQRQRCASIARRRGEDLRSSRVVLGSDAC